LLSGRIGSSSRFLLDAAQVSVLKRSRVLEAVAEQPVEPDMRQPDERELDAPVRVREHTDRAEGDRPERRVRRVVDPRARPRARQVAGEAQIRYQDEDDEQEPAEAL